ncbi:MAG: energy-coupling factor ABC transporter permease [Verrucomicrobiota bacterium]
MHIPDGFLDGKTAVAGTVISAGALALAMRQIRRRLTPARVPLIGLAAAFVFAAQMLNFPVYGGTSGHLIGATLAAVLLGPSAAMLVLSAVLILQCLLFNDGGVTALGANIFNMAILATGTGYGVYLAVRRIAGSSLRVQLLATAFAAWVSTVAAAIGCAGQLALSGTVAWNLALPAMTLVHLVIGIGEAFITTLVVAAIARTRPELLSESSQPNLQPQAGELVTHGLLISLGLAIFVAPMACSWPDGLEAIATRLGFEHKAAAPLFAAPLPDYVIPGLHSATVGTAIAGALGTIVAFALAYLLARWLTPAKPHTAS